MKDKDKTQKQPTKELTQLRRRIVELEAAGHKRNQFEEALRTERDRAQQYLDIAEVILVALNKKGEITLINRRGNQILGYKEGELLGKNWFTTCVPPRLRKKIKGGVKKLMAGEIKLTEFYENPALTKFGTERIIAWHNSLLKDTQGNPIGILSSGMDITERKQAEQRYQTILRIAMDGFGLVDMQGHYQDVNEAYCRIIGYSRDELLNMTIPDIEVIENSEDTAKHIRKIEEIGYDRFETRQRRKDGKIIDVEVSVTYLPADGGRMVAFYRDITERKRAEEAVRESEERYRVLFEEARDGIALADADTGILLDCNQALADLVGRNREELIGQHQTILHPPSGNNTGLSQTFKKHLTNKEGLVLETQVLTASGGIREVEIKANLLYLHGRKMLQGIFRNITERKQAEEVLRLNEEKYRLVVENAKEAIIITQDVKFVFVNRAGEDMIGYSREILTSKPFTEFIHPDDRNMVADHHIRRIKGEEVPPVYSFRILSQDGTVKWVELNAAVIQWKERPAILNFLNDITERKQAEEALHKSEDKYRTILENIEEGYYEVDLAGNFTFFNDSMCRIWGYPKEELMGMNNRQYTDKENAKRLFQAFNEVYRTGEIGKGYEYEIIKKDGTRSYVEASISLRKDSSGKVIGFRGIIRDITERKKAEKKLRESEEKYRDLVENINDIIYAIDEQGIITFISPAIEPLSGYTISEIIGRPFLEFVYQEDVSDVVQFFQQDISGRAEPHEYRMVTKSGDVLWGRTSSRPFFEADRVVGLRGILTNITERKQAEEEAKRSYERQRQALLATVDALASTVEMKDQYTAGHQPRVTQLACAIAEEMELSEDQIEGIRMAASIHDIGKIMVPAEILNKPGPLTELQFEMIKMHPKAGYDILKGIQFPWPVAEIVQQHHERLDGSGYPQGLSGEEIMVEAKILVVANVVEAMTAHRLYRPALDIKEALAEISKNRGILYDPTVVDICVKLFTEKAFMFSNGVGKPRSPRAAE